MPAKLPLVVRCERLRQPPETIAMWWTARRHLAAGAAGRVPPLSARQAQPTVQVGTGPITEIGADSSSIIGGRWSEASGVMPPNAGSELESGR